MNTATIIPRNVVATPRIMLLAVLLLIALLVATFMAGRAGRTSSSSAPARGASSLAPSPRVVSGTDPGCRVSHPLHVC